MASNCHMSHWELWNSQLPPRVWHKCLDLMRMLNLVFDYDALLPSLPIIIFNFEARDIRGSLELNPYCMEALFSLRDRLSDLERWNAQGTRKLPQPRQHDSEAAELRHHRPGQHPEPTLRYNHHSDKGHVPLVEEPSATPPRLTVLDAAEQDWEVSLCSSSV